MKTMIRTNNNITLVGRVTKVKEFGKDVAAVTIAVDNGRDKEGNDIGTGMGMYIVASTLREYNATYKIVEAVNGFGLDIKIPRGVK